MIRVGQGFDAHAFVPGAHVVIGGVEIPHDRGLGGHSDADVLSHAVADALLGAAGSGDLGALFPATDEWKNVSSLRILSEVATRLAGAGWECVNVDSTVIAEEPRLGPHRARMEKEIAAAIGIDDSVVSVKATTTDGLGMTGRGEGIAAMAVVLVQRREP